MTDDNQLWIPSLGKVQKKFDDEKCISSDTVDESIAGCIPYETLGHGKKSYYKIFPQVKRSQTVYYNLTGQDRDWKPCPTSDRLSL